MAILRIFFLLLFNTSLLTYAQNVFTQQVNGLIESSDNFYKYRGDLIFSNDSAYLSKITIENTQKNEILVAKGITIYSALVRDSVSLSKGKKIVDEWRDILNGILSSSFTLNPLKLEKWLPAKYGWKFSNNTTWVDISLFPGQKNHYCVRFTISKLDPSAANEIH